MKKNLLLTGLVVLACTLAFQVRAGDVSQKVLKSFRETFPKAEQVSWQEYSDNYVVNFVAVGLHETITYDKEGNFISSTRYLTEENLPTNILFRLKKKYPALKVFGVTEITTEANVEYYLKMEDDQHWVTIKADDGGMLLVVEKFEKIK